MLEKCYKIENDMRLYDFKTCLQYLNHLGRKRYGSNFTINLDDKLTLYKLIGYAIGSESIHEKGIDLTKGILLVGPVGCGKTSLMTLLNEFMYPFQRYHVKSTREIATEFNKEGYDIILSYGKREKTICLDDLGAEQNMKHFGNECNTVEEILLQRYDLFVNSGIVTHATTNLNADELEKIYGIRVRSRLRTMFNLINFPMDSSDKRK